MFLTRTSAVMPMGKQFYDPQITLFVNRHHLFWAGFKWPGYKMLMQGIWRGSKDTVNSGLEADTCILHLICE